MIRTKRYKLLLIALLAVIAAPALPFGPHASADVYMMRMQGDQGGLRVLLTGRLADSPWFQAVIDTDRDGWISNTTVVEGPPEEFERALWALYLQNRYYSSDTHYEWKRDAVSILGRTELNPGRGILIDHSRFLSAGAKRPMDAPALTRGNTVDTLYTLPLSFNTRWPELPHRSLYTRMITQGQPPRRPLPVDEAAVIASGALATPFGPRLAQNIYSSVAEPAFWEISAVQYALLGLLILCVLASPVAAFFIYRKWRQERDDMASLKLRVQQDLNQAEEALREASDQQKATQQEVLSLTNQLDTKVKTMQSQLRATEQTMRQDFSDNLNDLRTVIEPLKDGSAQSATLRRQFTRDLAQVQDSLMRHNRTLDRIVRRNVRSLLEWVRKPDESEQPEFADLPKWTPPAGYQELIEEERKRATEEKQSKASSSAKSNETSAESPGSSTETGVDSDDVHHGRLAKNEPPKVDDRHAIETVGWGVSTDDDGPGEDDAGSEDAVDNKTS